MTQLAARDDWLIDQYRLYVEMMDKASDRRSATNNFYVTILAGLLAALTFLEKDNPKPAQLFLLLGIGLVGVMLCVIWYVNLRSYRQLNKGKFDVIHKMEERLPFPCYDCEWDILTAGKYKPLTTVEQLLPWIMAVPYFGLGIYAVLSLLKLI